MTTPFVSGFRFRFGGAGSPTVLTEVCPVFNVSGVGKTNELVDVTTFCSNGVREYIGGLADGQEITIEANHILDDTALQDMVDAVNNKQVRDVQCLYTNGVLTETYTFQVAMLSWVVSPSTEDKNTITFTAKISGEIVRS